MSLIPSLMLVAMFSLVFHVAYSLKFNKIRQVHICYVTYINSMPFTRLRKSH